MDVSLFDFELPGDRIAQEAVEPRDAARLMVVDRACSKQPGHARVADLPGLLDAGDLLVVNDARVRSARLFGRRPSGGEVEILLVDPLDGREGDAERGRSMRWRALARASRSLRPGDEVRLDPRLSVRVVARDAEGPGVVIEFPNAEDALLAMSRLGEVPLPPYIRRERGDPRLAVDRSRYQTVFAREESAVAAPTAGLHFTTELLGKLESAGIGIAPLSLAVGEGTFRPVKVDDSDEIALPTEATDIPAETARRISETRAAGGRVVAVGTTVVRALEGRPASPSGGPVPGRGATDIVIVPGYRFRWVDALMTNFHLPRSTLLMLVAAFAGRELVLSRYRDAVASGYRFYSYGDAMLVL